MLSSKLKLNAFPGPIATHTGKDIFLVDVALGVFHLPLKEGNVLSVVKELEYHVFF